MALSSDHSSEWLNALPVSKLGLKLDNTALKIAVGLRLSTRLCSNFRCVCGDKVDSHGRHGLNCKVAQGRHRRHSEANNIIQRALGTCDFPSTLEPSSLCRSDQKRPDGLTHFSYKAGLPLVWDFTCVCTVAPSNLSASIQGAGKAADRSEKLKLKKYEDLKTDYHFVPVAAETFGSWGNQAKKFLEEVGNMLIKKTEEPRAKHFFYQRLSMAIIRGNVASVLGTAANSEKMSEIFYLS